MTVITWNPVLELAKRELASFQNKRFQRCITGMCNIQCIQWDGKRYGNIQQNIILFSSNWINFYYSWLWYHKGIIDGNCINLEFLVQFLISWKGLFFLTKSVMETIEKRFVHGNYQRKAHTLKTNNNSQTNFLKVNRFLNQIWK